MMQTIKGSNPIVKGHYADPEARYYEGKYWNNIPIGTELKLGGE